MRNTLATSFAAGFAAALVYTLASRGASLDSVLSFHGLPRGADDQNTTRLDGAPALTIVDTHGAPWVPSEAYEKDDPKVSPHALPR